MRTPAALLLVCLAPALALAQETGQAQPDTAVPTIPESQLGATAFNSPYLFIATVDAASEFQRQAGAFAAEKGEAEAVRALGTKLAADHEGIQERLRAAGEADAVEISAPSVDGPQQGLLGQLEAASAGPEFDRAYLDAQVFAHQRLVADYGGYAAGDTALNRFAAETLPLLQEGQAAVQAAADALGVTPTAPQ